MGVLRTSCVLLGDPTVGKSALAQVFHSDGAHYPKAYTMTTGVEYSVKQISFPDSEGDDVEFHLFDCAGGDIFWDLIASSCGEPAMCVLVYDVGQPESLAACTEWANRAKQLSAGAPLLGVLVGNKVDLEVRRRVSVEEGERVAGQLGFPHFAVSAKTGLDSEKPFEHLAAEFQRQHRGKQGGAAS